MKQEWATEEYTVCCTRNERSGLAWFKTGTWKLRGMRKGRRPLCSEGEDAIHILLKFSETRKWREQFLSRKWLRVPKVCPPLGGGGRKRHETILITKNK
jgi:hypothetical protein